MRAAVDSRRMRHTGPNQQQISWCKLGVLSFDESGALPFKHQTNLTTRMSFTRNNAGSKVYLDFTHPNG